MSACWWLGAFGADAVDFKTMAAHTKAMISGNSFKDRGNLLITKLHQLLAFFADEVVVLRITVVVFVNLTIIGSGHFADQSGFFE